MLQEYVWFVFQYLNKISQLSKILKCCQSRDMGVFGLYSNEK